MEFIKKTSIPPISLNPFTYFSNEKETDTKIQPKFNSGVINDRFESFLEYRKHYQSNFFNFLENDLFKETMSALDNSAIIKDVDDKKIRLLSSTNIELNTLKDKNNTNYLDLYNNTEILYKELEEDMILLKNKQKERIKTKVYESENKQIDKEIEKLLKLMTQKVKQCEKNIKEIQFIQNMYLTKIDIKIKDNIYMNLSRKIHEFSLDFRKNEEQFMENLKKLGSNSSIIDDEDTALKEFDKKYSGNSFLQEKDDSQMKKRNECIDSLVISINELSSVFKDLQVVVQEQGTILDRIDYNIDLALDNTKIAYGHISEANKLQKQSCFRNVVLIILFIIFIEAILIINKYL